MRGDKIPRKNEALENPKRGIHLHSSSLDLVAIVPAAGVGRRMGSPCPKQYLMMGNKTLLEHTVHRLLGHDLISYVVVVLSADDSFFVKTSLYNDPRVRVARGGEERADSVLAGLKATKAEWVMVHDAARPCICYQDIDALIDAACSHPDGAILGMPVRDTMKRSDLQGNIESTVCREQLWHALTPQMFLRDSLLNALEHALKEKHKVTDEAFAISLLGGRPKLVLGRSDNIKVTRPEDLLLAAFFLSQHP